MALLGLIFLAVAGSVTVIGLIAGGDKFRHRPTDPDRPDDVTDEDLARSKEYMSLPEKQEIDDLRNLAVSKNREKNKPVFDEMSFNRLLELTRHPNITVRGASLFLLGSMTSEANRPPGDSVPERVAQNDACQGQTG